MTSDASLLYFEGSPFARMARVVCLEWSLPVSQVCLDFPADQSLFKANPMGQVPVLIEGDSHLFPTFLILERLWQLAGRPVDTFDPGRDRQTLLTILNLGDAVVGALYQDWAGLRPSAENSLGFDPAERHLSRLPHVLQWVQGRLPDEMLSLVNIALACLLLWIDARNGPDWRTNSEIAALVDQLADRPSFRATAPQSWRSVT